MSNLLPKIAIGVDTHKGQFDLSCLTHTTSEIGFVQPTYSKLFVPNSKVRLQTRTGARLSSLFVPTMGQIDIRHYHFFVPISAVWAQFKYFKEKIPYTLPDGTTFIPTIAPNFSVGSVIYSLLSRVSTNYKAALASELGVTIYNTTIESNKVGNALSAEEIEALGEGEGLTNLFEGLSTMRFVPKYLRGVASDGSLRVYEVTETVDSGRTIYGVERVDNYVNEINDSSWNKLSFPSFDACDFLNYSHYVRSNGSSTTAIICYNLNGSLKRLRNMFIGLGYSFNPWDNTMVTPFKLLAYYKAYWMKFCVSRQYNFYNTYCYKCIKFMSDHSMTIISGTPAFWELFLNFLAEELCQCRYICPADYYSASDLDTQRSASESDGYSFSSPQSMTNRSDFELGWNPQTASSSVYRGHADPVAVSTNPSNALAQRIALRLLRFVNKNSAIGRRIDTLWRARYGVSPFVSVLEGGVDKVGDSSTPILIDAIYNQTDSAEFPLGSYAGMGVTTKNKAVSDKFTFSVSEHGFLITLSAVVPKMGYFQGMLHENSDGVGGPLDFYTPEFDALGWQAVRYNELISDRQFRLDSDTVVGTNLGIFGYMPTYSHLKVSAKNIVNGDISLPSKQESMLSYTLDRFFPQREFTAVNKSFVVPALPANEPNSFRAGTQGRTNRIFSDVSPTDDHVIMQIYFDIHMTAPMKPLTTSFDTIDEESTHTIEVNHQ